MISDIGLDQWDVAFHSEANCATGLTPLPHSPSTPLPKTV